MLNDSAMSDVLAQLDGIANAPLTGYQREIRAQGVLAEAGVTIPEVVKAMLTYRLSWNQRKAQECGVDVDTWLQAVRIAKQSQGECLGDLLERIHQMEAVVAMLRAGYIPGQDAHGRLVWSH